MVDWSKGYSASYVLMVIDPTTWAERESYEFISGSVDRKLDTDLKESAAITAAEKIGIGEEWIRIYLQANQIGASARVPIFTGLTSSPKRELNGHRVKWNVECYSVLKPADDVLLDRGYYAPAGSNANTVKELLSVSPAPIIIDGESPVLENHLVSENDETRLSMALKILDAIGWYIRIDGDGTVVISEPPSESSITFSPDVNDSIEINVNDTEDWYNCPNIFRAVSEDGGSAIARDDNPKSALSTVNRGREIWKSESNVALAKGETIAAYAIRRLRQEQAPARLLSYDRRYYDNLLPGDMITLNYPGYGLVGTFRIQTQSITLGHSCKTGEEVIRVE